MSNTKSRENNFNILRLVAALMVIGGHMGYILGTSRPLLFSQEIQTVGVKIFFLIGGYLIAKSWMSDSNIIRYALKRFFRIMPALILYTILATFVFGPLLSELGYIEYFKHQGTLNYLRNIFLHVEYFLPGVFAYNPYPNAVNGSLWTLPVEVALYVLVPIILSVIMRYKKRTDKTQFVILLLLTIGVCVFQIVHLYLFPQWRMVIYGTDIAQAFDLIPYYLIGMLYTFPYIRRYLNLQIAVVAILVCSCIQLNMAGSMLIMYVVFPYIVFSIALTEKPFFKNVMDKYEISYGLYLYGFFVQQATVYVCMKIGWWPSFIECFIISTIITAVLAWISFVVIERPAQRFCKLLLKKIK